MVILDIAECTVTGQNFHNQLECLLGHENHPEDLNHDFQVGQAILIAIQYKSPELAEIIYNNWAKTAGYAEIVYIGTLKSSTGVEEVIIDIRTAHIAIDQYYTVRLF